MKIRVLGISCSPRPNGSSEKLLDEALAGAISADDVEVDRYTFAGKKFAPCNALCVEYCKAHGRCAIKDDFEDLRIHYAAADAVIWSAPVYQNAPPQQGLYRAGTGFQPLGWPGAGHPVLQP